MNKRLIAQEHSRYDQADEIGRQNCFALRGGGEAAEKEQNEKDELYFRFAHACRTQLVDDRFCPCRHEPKHHAHADYEHEQPDVVVCKESAERQDGAKIGDEAGGQNHLSHRGIAIAAFD